MILDGDHQRPWQPGEKRESRIVFIGRKLPMDKIPNAAKLYPQYKPKEPYGVPVAAKY